MTLKFPGGEIMATDPNIDKYMSKAKERIDGNQTDISKKADLKGGVTVKKPLGRKFTDAMIGADISDVKSFLIWDCLVPSLKYAILDSILMLFGEGPARRGGARNINQVQRQNVNYAGYSSINTGNGNRSTYQSNNQARVSTRFATDELLFDYREDAEEVLDILVDHLTEFGHITVADVFDQAGVTVDDFTMNDWGWRDLSQVKIRKSRGYWVIDFPRPISLK